MSSKKIKFRINLRGYDLNNKIFILSLSRLYMLVLGFISEGVNVTVSFYHFIIFGSYKLYACDCLLQPIENDFKNVKYVVTAEVIELLDTKYEREEFHMSQNDKKSYRVRIIITKSFKNGFKKGQIIELDSKFTNCDPLFELGEIYLLFLYKMGDLYLEIPCTYWGKVSDSQENIETITKFAKRHKTRKTKH